MFRVSKMNDYAVVVMGHMAAQGSRLHSANGIAEGTGLPPATVSQVLKKLAHADLVLSQRGARGGYRLARHPHEISMADVIVALEGPIALTACVDGAEGQCSVETMCPMRGGWDRVNEAVRKAIGQVSLADMLSPSDWRVDGRAAPAAVTSNFAS